MGSRWAELLLKRRWLVVSTTRTLSGPCCLLLLLAASSATWILPYSFFSIISHALPAVGLAARTHGSSPAARHRLLEPVLASLTAQQRSLSGVTQRNVDLALDSVMDAVFTPPFLR